jgi:hypothetical protein
MSMGCQITAGDRAIRFSDGARMVADWCDRFTPPARPESMTEFEWVEMIGGNIQIAVNSVKTADARVPTDFQAASAEGLLDGLGRQEIDERAFHQCRDFLAYASRSGLEIVGGY